MEHGDRERIPNVPSTAYQRLRQLSLGLSLAVLFGVPLIALAGMDPARSPRGSRFFDLSLLLSGGSNAVLGAPWSISIFGFEIMDPLAFAGLLLAGAFTVSALIATAPTVAAIALGGRFFCGWICPYVPLLALSNRTRALLTKKGVTLPDLRLPERMPVLILFGLGALTFALGAQVFSLIYPPAIIARTISRAVIFGGFGLGSAVIGVIWLFDTFVSRAGFCRSICPGGALMALLATKSPVRVVRSADLCTHCKDCDVVCNLGQQPMSDKLDGGCERCGKCIDVCEVDALKLAFRASRLPIVSGPPPESRREG